MSSTGNYIDTLRGKTKTKEQFEEGVPFFVPQLSKVKTSVTCGSSDKNLLFGFEKPMKDNVSYRKQGDKTLYTDENISKRQKLRDEPQVLAAMSRYWDTFNSVRTKGVLRKSDYIDVFVKMFKALVKPEEFSLHEARQIVQKDWEKDVGEDVVSLTKPLFMKSLFEVADIWTPAIGALEYCTFLNKLFQRITMVIYDQDKAMWLTKFADLDAIKSFYDPDEDNHTEDTVGKLETGIAADRGQRRKLRRSRSSSESVDRVPPIKSEKPPLVRSKTENDQVAKGISSRRRGSAALSPDLKPGLLGKLSRQDSSQKIAMPNIFLNPEIDHSKDSEASRKKIVDELTKRIQRSKRLTM